MGVDGSTCEWDQLAQATSRKGSKASPGWPADAAPSIQCHHTRGLMHWSLHFPPNVRPRRWRRTCGDEGELLISPTSRP